MIRSHAVHAHFAACIQLHFGYIQAFKELWLLLVPEPITIVILVRFVS